MAGCGSFQSAVLSTSLKQLLEGSSRGLQCRGLGGIWAWLEGFCFCVWVEAGRRVAGVIYLFDFVNRSCKAI